MCDVGWSIEAERVAVLTRVDELFSLPTSGSGEVVGRRFGAMGMGAVADAPGVSFKGTTVYVPFFRVGFSEVCVAFPQAGLRVAVAGWCLWLSPV